MPNEKPEKLSIEDIFSIMGVEMVMGGERKENGRRKML